MQTKKKEKWYDGMENAHVFKAMDDKREAIQTQDDAAMKAGTLVGRLVTEGMGDGYAWYVIVKENKKTVKMQVQTGIGDDWCIPYWGPNPTVDKAYVLHRLRGIENMRRLFPGKPDRKRCHGNHH